MFTKQRNLKHHTKRIISLNLALFLALSLIKAMPVYVSAAPAIPGNGTSLSPYLISTEAQLRALAAGEYSYAAVYVLMNDIVLTDDEWIPIGTSDSEFLGVFEGRGYKISNLHITENYSYAGLFGVNGGNIRNLGVQADIRASNYAGCVAGYNYGEIVYCYSEGRVSAWRAGGLVGYNSRNGPLRIGTGSVTNCYSRAETESRNLKTASDRAGGLVCAMVSGSLKRCYSTGLSVEESGWTGHRLAGFGDGYGNRFYSYSVGDEEWSITPAQGKLKASYRGWDFVNVWDISPDINDGYPFLRPNAQQGYPAIAGDGLTELTPYQITNEEQLISMAAEDYPNSYKAFYILNNDIELTLDRWYPSDFNGCFNGNGHTISNINVIDDDSYYYYGFFRRNYGVIENLGVSGTFRGNSVGAIAGANLQQGTIRNCYSEGSVVSTDSMGVAGGLVGLNSADTYYPLLNPTISNCYSTASVTAPYRVGGLIGEVSGGTVEFSYAAGPVGVSSTSAVPGGLIAFISTSEPPVTTSNYYDTQTTLQSDSKGATGRFSFQMIEIETYAGWDFTSTWALESGVNGGFPHLRVFQKPDEEQQQAAAPVITPAPGIVMSGTSFALSTETEGASIYYTTDGSTPSSSSRLYTSPIQIFIEADYNVTFKAIACKSGMKDSEVSTFSYTIKPIPQQAAAPSADPAPGTVPSGTSVALSTTTTGASIRYTTDGSTPTSSSRLYTTPIQITTDTTIKAIACKEGMTDSAVSTFAYKIQKPVVYIEIEDPILEEVIRSELDKPTGGITTEDALSVGYITADYYGIKSLSGLEHFTNLYSLRFNNNEISDISPLAGLTELTTLRLINNQIKDITPLSGLTKLELLQLNNNQIADIAPLSALTELDCLTLSDNNISNISTLAGLSKLRIVNLMNNDIQDISPLAGLTGLETLNVDNCEISDISPLANVDTIWYLGLGGNKISDISALAGMKEIREIRLNDNLITDISAIANLEKMTFVDMTGNYLDTSSGSKAMQIIEEFISRPVKTVTYLPQNSPVVYTVTYDKNGGDTDASPKTQAVAYPATTIGTLPTPPARAGYSFAGWNTAANGSGSVFTTSTAVTGSVTVYAQWTQITYTVSVAPLVNGTITPDKTSVAAGETITLTITPNSGYKLKAGSLKYNGNVISGNSFTMPAANVTITAEFEEIEPEIDPDAITFTVENRTARAGQSIQVPILLTKNPGIAVAEITITLGAGLEWDYDPSQYSNASKNSQTWPYISGNSVRLTGRPPAMAQSTDFAFLNFDADEMESFDSVGDGTLLTLKLKVSDDVVAGETLSIEVEIRSCNNAAVTSPAYTSAASGTVTTLAPAVAPLITTDKLPDATVGTAYNQPLAATGATPITWEIESGSLPNGLTLSNDGVISGTPTVDGTYYFVVMATNEAGVDLKPFSIVVSGSGSGSVGNAKLVSDTWVFETDYPGLEEIVFDAGWQIQSLLGEGAINRINWSKGSQSISVNGGGAFAGIMQLINVNTKAIKYLGIEKLIGVSSGEFDGIDWHLSNGLTDDAVLSVVDWEILLVLHNAVGDVVDYDTQTVTIDKDAGEFDAIVKLKHIGTGQVKYIGISKQ